MRTIFSFKEVHMLLQKRANSSNHNLTMRVFFFCFTGTNATFTSPRTQKYVIFGSVFTTGVVSNCTNVFRLQSHGKEILKSGVAEIFSRDDVELRKEATLSVMLNCKVFIDEDKSKLFIYQHNSC